jgi:precorrin-6B methylase 2
MPAEATLYSNEVNRKRANILYENIRKQGYPNVIVTSCSSADYGASGQDFDIILTDVPCSGEGMFRKDPDTISEWSLQNVMKCSKLQREIVADVWPRLKPGGLLIYSTCTFNLHENEENILWILSSLGGELLPVETKPEWNITSSLLPELQGPVYRFIPGITRGEGLFMAVIRKTDNASHPRKSSSSFQLSRAAMNPDILFPAPSQGVVKSKSPQASIASHTSHASLANEAVSVPLTRTQALQYLHREALILPPDTPKGIVIVTYRNLPLGYAKNIGSRANNLYPQEWRIRKQI